jgi:F-box-like
MSMSYDATASNAGKRSAIKSSIRNLLDARDVCFCNKFLSREATKHRLRYDCSPPINRLPVEILGEIFGQRLLDIRPLHMRITHHSLSPSPYTDPQVLGEVCSYWRDVTLATPALWSTICITKPKQRHVQKVILWLERSRTYGLSLKLTQPITLGPRDHSVTDEILSLLVIHVHRWREIEFSFTSVAQQPLLKICHGAASALQSAVISNGFWDHASMNRLWQVVHSSPALHHIDWTWSCNEAPEHLSFSQLTHVTLHWVFSVEMLLDILRSCRQVIELRLYSLWSDYSPGSLPPLVLPNLRVLSLTDGTDPGPLFRRLTLPSLTSLEFTAPMNHQNDLLDLLERSYCSLGKFTLSGLFRNEADVPAYPRLIKNRSTKR